MLIDYTQYSLSKIDGELICISFRWYFAIRKIFQLHSDNVDIVEISL